MTKNLKIIFFLISISFALFSFKGGEEQFRSRINLSGEWLFSLDPENIGIRQNWFSKSLDDVIQLPGTTDSNKKGIKNTTVSTLHLNRVFTYEGPAWYKKKIMIPENWKGKHIELKMERSKPSKVWIDGNFVGESILLQSPQKYSLEQYLTPGEHTITIRIDNSVKLTPYGSVHIYSDDTQTNWNGVIGDFHLEASDKNYIKNVQVYPDIDQKKIKVAIAIQNERKLKKIDVKLEITKTVNGKTTQLTPQNYTVSYDSIVHLEHSIGNETELWDEYNTPIYHLNTVISSKGKFKDNLKVPFGMRKFATKGTNFTINDRVTFLRGKHDACVFPLTGHPPMDTEGWIHVFKIAKSYGINHYRFHSWCPPNAAFDAADQVGIYLQPELPFWGGLDSDSTATMLQTEGIELMKNYANHPSFVLFAAGNEIWSGHDRAEKVISNLKKADNRHLYALGANNSIGYEAPRPIQDFHIAARIPGKDSTLTHIRLSHGFVDSKEGGILNLIEPSNNFNYDFPVSQIKIPLVSHEIGQYQIYPNYNEIAKYTGVLRATNLQEFKRRLEKKGMLAQNAAFTKASGALSVLGYRAEIEAALRTKGFAGFQLLDLQDYPGQGTALVGILDSFMDSKNVISKEEWSHFCNDVVPLLLFDKYCWTQNETFTAKLQIANYSNKNIQNNISWTVKDENNNLVSTGTFDAVTISVGGLSDIGKISLPLASQKVPQKLTITVAIENTNYENSYPIWIYPEPKTIKKEESISIATALNNDLFNQLKKGKKVLLFPSAESVKNNSVPGLFNADFWNYGMFKGFSESTKKAVSPGTLGILTNPTHPIFKSFPTEFHTNWQWWNIIKHSNSLILNNTLEDYKPIVQIIDNLERNDKMGMIFEFKVGKGKLLICMARLMEISDKPEANQLYHSIINYMKSDEFTPNYEIDEAMLYQLIQ